jgi:hypothetical protein
MARSRPKLMLSLIVVVGLGLPNIALSAVPKSNQAAQKVELLLRGAAEAIASSAYDRAEKLLLRAEGESKADWEAANGVAYYRATLAAYR